MSTRPTEQTRSLNHDINLVKVTKLLTELDVAHAAEPALGRPEHECAILGQQVRSPRVASLTLGLSAGDHEGAEVQIAVDHQPDVVREACHVHDE